MMSASHDEAHMEVPQVHESVDSRESVAGGRQMSTVELPQMEGPGMGHSGGATEPPSNIGPRSLRLLSPLVVHCVHNWPPGALQL